MQKEKGARRRMEADYLNLSLSPFQVMRYHFGQIQLKAKGLKNQMIQSIEVRIPGQRPAEKRELVSM